MNSESYRIEPPQRTLRAKTIPTMNPSAATHTTRRILGIDPGLRITGFGMIEQNGNRLSYIVSGCIRTDEKMILPDRLGTIFSGVGEIIAAQHPDEAAIEQVFVNVNPQSTLMLGQARGAAICAMVATGLKVAEYTALQIKQSVVGHGRADKTQVQHMVRRLLDLPGDPSADAADALACAICHAHGSNRYGTASTGAYRVRQGRLLS